VYRGEAAAESVGLDFAEQARGALRGVEIGPDEQARPCGGRKRYSNRELRVVAPPEAVVSLRPGEIKHELAVGVALDESRRGGCQPPLVAQCDVGGVPAGAGTDAPGVLQRGQEFMSQERIAISSEGIPLPGVELIDAVMDTRTWWRLGQECFSMSNPSR
jgi:hypothetical protein